MKQELSTVAIDLAKKITFQRITWWSRQGALVPFDVRPSRAILLDDITV